MIEPTLETLIKDKVKQSEGAKISFYEFMEMALYHETHGYYNRPSLKIGKQGDFYTSSSVNEVFGFVVADQIVEMIGYMDEVPISLIEYGGGNGALAAHILERLSSYSHIYSKITLFMIEKSGYHKVLQQEKLSDYKGKVFWVENLNEIDKITSNKNGIIYSNELVDAFPVHRIRYHHGGWEEQFVVIDEASNRLKLEFSHQLSPFLLNFIVSNNIALQEGQEAEVNLSSAEWMNSVGEWLESGFVITIDYGFQRAELYAPFRRNGTLTCYYQHRNDTSPLNHIGEQDITSHVDFTSLIEAGEQLGLKKAAFIPQYEFLLKCGIFSYLKDAIGKDPFSDVAKRNRAIRQLIQSGGMGDAFSVLVQVKGLDNVSLRCSQEQTFYPL